MQKPHEEELVKDVLNSLVKGWFFNKFKSFSLPQLYGVLEIHKKKKTASVFRLLTETNATDV